MLLQDFTGVPCVVDLAAMRDAMAAMGGDPKAINPLQPVELVIDHSVQVDYFGSNDALAKNTDLEFERNRERYAFLKWGQAALADLRVVPPDTGIVHQVNIEYLRASSSAVAIVERPMAYPDTAVGTDSHTTMVNGLGVLAWGVGGIEAEAAMLGQPVTMLIPEVVGFRLDGALREGVTATDLVLTVTEMLRKKGVVGKFVEFYGTGLSALPVVDRTTIGNMSPEFGSTVAIFPIDDRTLEYLRLTGRSREHIALVEAYAKAQGLFRTDDAADPEFTDTLQLDLASVEPSLAGPRRPQDRVPLRDVKRTFRVALDEWPAARERANGAVARFENEGGGGTATISRTAEDVADGAVVIAAITSCTNTSNPSVLIGAGLLARNARRTRAADAAVGEDVARARLESRDRLSGEGGTAAVSRSARLQSRRLRLHDVHRQLRAASGRRRRNGRRSRPDRRRGALGQPQLRRAHSSAGARELSRVAAARGRVRARRTHGRRSDDRTARHRQRRAAGLSEGHLAEQRRDRRDDGELHQRRDVHARVRRRVQGRRELERAQRRGERTLRVGSEVGVRQAAAVLRRHAGAAAATARRHGARAIAVLGDSVTTDHISPAGNIAKNSPAGRYLMEHGIEPNDFNSYGARRGNHEVMVRGTFANVRLRNALVPGVEGGVTRYLPANEQMSIFDAAVKYRADGTPLIVLAGKEYGSGSSRDWAAKGPYLLGIKAVIAESFERIHRSNLIGMGVLPLEYLDGADRSTFGLTGEEIYDITGIAGGITPRMRVHVKATDPATGRSIEFEARVRIDTPDEAEYYRHGGILQYVLRQLAK